MSRFNVPVYPYRIGSVLVALILAVLMLMVGAPAQGAGIVVNSADDSVIDDDGQCTLREAIHNANNDAAPGTVSGECAAGSGADEITFAADYTITLAGSQLPVVTTEMTITGNGAADTIIQASTCNPVTLPDGCTPATHRVFEVSAAGNLSLDGVTARHGRCVAACATAPLSGGGIYSQGTLAVTNSTLSGNLAYIGAGLFNDFGSATLTNSTLSGNLATNGSGLAIVGGTATVTNSTLSGNSASDSGGGLAIVGGTATVTNSTLSGNSAYYDGGGLYNVGGMATVTNSTLSGNSATDQGGGVYMVGSTATVTSSTLSGNSASSGGSLYKNGGTVTVTNSLVAGASGGNCLNISLDASNIANDATCGSATQKTTAEIALGPLQANGGPTHTHALLAGSHAIDFIDSASCAGDPVNGLDQRGQPRNVDVPGVGSDTTHLCDTGAYELEAPTTAKLTIVKTVSGFNAPGDWSFAFTGDLGSFSLTDEDPDMTDIAVVPGSVAVNETNPGGYETTIDCDSGDASGNGNLSLTLDAGDDVTCTFTNEICQPGYYDTATGWNCEPSDPGYYVDTVGASQQTPCPPGYYQDAPDQGSCYAADPGYYATGPAATEEIECQPGRWQDQQGQASCHLADPGYYATGPAATAQTACPTGTTSPAGSDSADDCVSVYPEIYLSANTAGTTGDGLSFGSEDILMWDGTAWSKWFDGDADANLNPVKTYHNIDAFWIPDPSGEEVFLSFTRNQRPVPGINGMVDGMDIVRWGGSAFTLLFDGQDVGLQNLTAENIDALHVLPGSEWPGSPASCLHYLLISTKGAGNVPAGGGGTLKFSGEDVLGFCLTQAGAQTTGLWTMVLDGSTVGMNKGSTDSISVSDDGQTLHLTTTSKFTVNGVLLGNKSMVFAYDLGTQTFGLPLFNAPANGLPKVVDGLQVVGDLP